MQKLGFPTLKSMDQLRSFKTPLSGTGRASLIVIPSPPPADSINYGSFATLKRTAEKLIQEQASVKTDLEMAVLEMLETGKAMLSNLSQQFEERLITIHKEQVDKWQEEIKELRSLDSSNAATHALLQNAQFHLFQSVTEEDS